MPILILGGLDIVVNAWYCYRIHSFNDRKKNANKLLNIHIKEYV